MGSSPANVTAAREPHAGLRGRTWQRLEPTLDTDPPETLIDKGPKKKTAKPYRAKFKFSADEPATYECSSTRATSSRATRARSSSREAQ